MYFQKQMNSFYFLHIFVSENTYMCMYLICSFHGKYGYVTFFSTIIVTYIKCSEQKLEISSLQKEDLL